MRIISVLLVLSLVGCRGPDASDIIHVPLESKMPYQDFKFREFGKATLAPITMDIPEEVIHVRRFLGDPDSYSQDNLGIDHRGDVFIASLSNGNFLILDRLDNRLIQYDLRTHSSRIVAEQGEGPGEISLSKDLIVTDDIVLVGRTDRRISEFDCSKDVCVAASSLSLDVSVYSLDTVGPDSLAVMGVAPVKEAVGLTMELDAAGRKSVIVVDR